MGENTLGAGVPEPYRWPARNLLPLFLIKNRIRRNVMKRIFLHVVVVLLVIGFLSACGGGDGTQGAAEAKASKAKGSVFENDFFKADIPEGWTVFDDSKVAMMRIYPEKDKSVFAPTIHLKFEGKKAGRSEWSGTPEQSIADMAKNYKGTAPEKVVINGVEYYKTTYDYGGKQTMMVARKDGTKITVTLVGRDYHKNPTIEEILKTISYK